MFVKPTSPAAASDTIILIPARLASTRLPDKPLAEIRGLPTIVQWTPYESTRERFVSWGAWFAQRGYAAVVVDVRGRYEAGPLVESLPDAFGLCELSRSFTTVAHMTVVPQVVGLPTVRLAGEHAGSGDSRARSVAVHGEDDVATREYRHGDSQRRIDWKATSRRQTLISREYEEEKNQQVVLLVDCGRRMRARDGELSVYLHEGHWDPMDTYRDYKLLNGLWEKGQATWKMW